MAGNRLRRRTRDALTRLRPPLLAAGRLATAAIVLLVVTLVAIQYARAVEENVAAAHQLAAIRHDIAALARQRDEQQRELQRLRDPAGAVPDIHDRLRLVKPNEVLIFLRPAPSGTP